MMTQNWQEVNSLIPELFQGGFIRPAENPALAKKLGQGTLEIDHERTV